LKLEARLLEACRAYRKDLLFLFSTDIHMPGYSLDACATACFLPGSHTQRSTDFFGRDQELALLTQRGNSGCTTIGVVLGRVNCGKTKLLEEYVARRDGKGICYIDGRRRHISDPSGGQGRAGLHASSSI
jgi:hypothetical protein